MLTRRAAPLLLGLAVIAMTLPTVDVAVAQPGADPLPGAGEPPPPPTSQPPPPFQPRYAVIMTPEERELVLRGEISTGRYIAGGIVAYAAGFGIGHAVQGRWSEDGWIFTVGEAASLGILIVGLADCIDNSGNNCAEHLLIGGLIGLTGFRIWELVDAWVAPHFHNRRVRRIRAKYNLGPDALPYRANLHLAPVKGGGVTGGFSLRF